MKRNARKTTTFFTMIGFTGLAIILLLGTGACVAEEGNPEEMADIQETVEEAVVENEEEMAPTGMSLSTDMDVYAPDETITVIFTADETISTDAFIGMIVAGSLPESVETTDYIVTEKINGMMSGELMFTAPVESGEYELRMIDNNEIILAISFVVE